MKKFLLAIALTCFSCLSCFATDFQMPVQKIEGADESIPFGEVIILNPTSVKNTPKYLHTISYSWKILVDGKEKTRFKTFSDGSVVFGGTPDQHITALLVISYLYIVREGDKPDGAIKEVGQKQSDILMANVVVEASKDPNPPKPNPKPAPVDKFGLTNLTNNWLSTVTLSGEKKTSTVALMANVFSSLADSIASGKITTQEELIKQSQTMTAGVLTNGALQSAWQTWATNLNGELSKLLKAGKLVNLGDWQQAYKEVAAGLSK